MAWENWMFTFSILHITFPVFIHAMVSYYSHIPKHLKTTSDSCTSFAIMYSKNETIYFTSHWQQRWKVSKCLFLNTSAFLTFLSKCSQNKYLIKCSLKNFQFLSSRFAVCSSSVLISNSVSLWISWSKLLCFLHGNRIYSKVLNNKL